MDFLPHLLILNLRVLLRHVRDDLVPEGRGEEADVAGETGPLSPAAAVRAGGKVCGIQKTFRVFNLQNYSGNKNFLLKISQFTCSFKFKL